MKNIEHIEVKDLKIGTIDARQEILARDPAKRQLFMNSFYAPPSFRAENLVSGDKFIICGLSDTRFKI